MPNHVPERFPASVSEERATAAGDTRYPSGTVRALLETDLVTPQTRDALKRRLDRRTAREPRFFEHGDFLTLQAVCARLIPQPDRAEPIDLAGLFDARLTDGLGDGWRYAAMPPDRAAHVRGLRGIEATAQALFGASFRSLEEGDRDAVLTAVQRGDAPGPTWRNIPALRYFEDLLAELVDIYYAHPLAHEEIGHAGMADAHGWQAVGLGRRDSHEPIAEDALPAQLRGAA